MSTRIFGAYKIPATDLKGLIQIAQETQAVEIPALIQRFGAKHHLYMPSRMRDAINSIEPSHQRAFRKAVDAYAALWQANPTINRETPDAGYALSKLRVAFGDGDLLNADLLSILDVIEDIAVARKLSFLPTERGFSLLKTYELADETRKWLSAKYEEFDYQNSTDGPALEYLDPEMDRVLKEAQADFLDCEMSGADDATQKAVRKAMEHIQYRVSNALYDMRSAIWDEAMNGVTNFAQSSLSFDLFSGFINEVGTVCMRTIRQAALPESEQDADALAIAAAEKEKEDAFVARILAKRESREQE